MVEQGREASTAIHDHKRKACDHIFLGILTTVKVVEDASGVEYGSSPRLGLTRVGTRIAQNKLEIHRGSSIPCGNGGKPGAGGS